MHGQKIGDAVQVSAASLRLAVLLLSNTFALLLQIINLLAFGSILCGLQRMRKMVFGVF